ncbi:MAG: ZIP family metal transporter [Fluviibacter phosphoraccumulans]
MSTYYQEVNPLKATQAYQYRHSPSTLLPIDNFCLSLTIGAMLLSSLKSGSLSQHINNHPFASIGLGVSCITIFALLLTGLLDILTGEHTTTIRYALWGGFAGFAMTTVGAIPGYFLKSLPQKIEDSLLGLAAGMMLSASSFSLILPGLQAAETMTGNALLGALTVVAGMAIGVMLMVGMDEFTPHEHTHTGTYGPETRRLSRIWLFVLAIALHNIPEGMAIGVSFAQGDLQVGVPLTSAIAMQDIPEGLAVVMALRSVGYGRLKSVIIASMTGLLEPLGAVMGITLSSGLAIAYPVGLGLAAGAMIFVVSNEVIPETHRNGNQRFATIGLVIGFALMMTLDTAIS